MFAPLRLHTEEHLTDHALPASKRLAVSPAEAARMLGLGKTKLYQLLGDHEIASVKVGTRRLIRVAELEAWLAEQEASADTPP